MDFFSQKQLTNLLINVSLFPCYNWFCISIFQYLSPLIFKFLHISVQPSALTKYKEGLIESEFKTPAYFFQMNSCQVEEGRLARFDCRVVAYPRPDIVW